MATRPWVTPEQVKGYTENKKVAERTDERLRVDISRAELYVINYTKNRFEDNVKFPSMPESVLTAVILVAETYASTAAELTDGKGTYKSESFDDYSYQLAGAEERINNLSLGPLLDDFIIQEKGGNVVMKLRRL